MGRGHNYFKNLRDIDLQHLLISSMSRRKSWHYWPEGKTRPSSSFSQYQLVKTAWSGPWLAAGQKKN